MKTRLALLVLSILMSWLSASSRILNVPSQDYPTIQAGIDSALAGDTVLVTPGTYDENIVFRGRPIVLGSHFIITHDDSYINSTIIDGGARASVIAIIYGDGLGTTVEGLTIQNGNTHSSGGGICIGGPETRPLIRNNRIISNASTYDGGGIACYAECNATICYNYIAYNRSESDNGGGISAIQCTTYVYNNLIISNYAKL